jgi:hypothetical protein
MMSIPTTPQPPESMMPFKNLAAWCPFYTPRYYSCFFVLAGSGKGAEPLF